MAAKTVSFNAHCNLYDSHLECVAKWLSCNGEVWGVGPTAVFASAAALFLYNELEATIYIAGDHAHVSMMEKTLISTMVLGMLALMIHLWVCAMRFFQYYLDTIIKDSPNMLLEMTTAGLLGGQADMVALGPLTRFLRQQQPQIHITVCWFLSLCYADYVRKHYCQRFNMPYLEQWQTELHERAVRGVQNTMEKVNSFVGSVHQRLRGFVPPGPQTSERQTYGAVILSFQILVMLITIYLMDALGITLSTRVKTLLQRGRRSTSVGRVAGCRGALGPLQPPAPQRRPAARRRSYVFGSLANPVRPPQMPSKNCGVTFPRRDVPVALHRTKEYAVLAQTLQKKPSLEDFPWRKIQKLQYDSYD